MRCFLLNALLVILWIGVLASGCRSHQTLASNQLRGNFIANADCSYCTLEKGFILQLPPTIDTAFAVSIRQFSRELNKWIKTDKAKVRIICQIDDKMAHYGEDDFNVKITPSQINIQVRNSETIPIALNWLRSFILEKQGKLPTGNYKDYSRIKYRALHLVMTGADPIDTLKNWIDEAAIVKFNTLILQLTPGILLDGFDPVKLEKKWTKSQFIELVNYAKQSGFQVIPELTLLTKQNKLFADSNPELLYNEQTYDPENPEVYERVYKLIDELTEICKPKFFHIGHDELHGIKGKPETAHVRILPQHLFIQDVKKIHAYLTAKGMRTMMWSDMLLDPKLFPEMRKVSLLGINGYENTAQFIPKGIIQCDWHYKDVLDTYPTTTWLNQQGFDVWGCTWDNLETIEAFSTFMANVPLNGQKGMIATTWHRVLKEYRIQTIIKTAGDAFWKS